MARRDRPRVGELPSRAGRVAFALGLLLSLAVVAGYVAVRSLSTITDATSSSALELYLDDAGAFELDVAGYTVDFPDQPDQRGTQVPLVAFQSTDEVDGNLYTFDAGGSTTFELITFERREAFRKGAAPAPAVLAQTAVLGFANAVKGDAGEMKPVDDAELPAWDATVKYSVRRPENLDYTVLVRVLVSDTTLYMLRVSAPGDTGGQRGGFKIFADSFVSGADEV
jgi:hypothetical protein